MALAALGIRTAYWELSDQPTKDAHMRRILTLAATLVATLLFALPASAGVSGPAFYADGGVYRTVGTPTDLSGTGAPASSFDTIWDIADQMNVAEAAPGDRDYNGGRWMVHALDYSDYDAVLDAGDLNHNGVLDSTQEVEAAIDAGVATDGGVVRSFVCPVIPLPRGR